MFTSMAGIFVSSFVIALSGALMPGPLLTATISESSQRGFAAGPLMIAGHALLELFLVIILLLGLAPFFQLPVVFVVCALAGSAILFWMAFGMLRNVPKLSLSSAAGQGRLSHPVLSGIIMSVSNPYWIIWWATIGIGYILYSWQFGVWGVIFFFTGHILAGAFLPTGFTGALSPCAVSFWLCSRATSLTRDLINSRASFHKPVPVRPMISLW